MEHVPLPSTPPRPLSPQRSVDPQTPYGSRSTEAELEGTPITPPIVYGEESHRASVTEHPNISWKIHQFQDISSAHSHPATEGHILLFRSDDPFSNLTLGKTIGEGQWSRVSIAKETSINPSFNKGHVYAVKVPSSKFATKVIRHESKILTYLSCKENYEQHVVGYYGYDLRHQALVLEYLGVPSGFSLPDVLTTGMCTPLGVARDLIQGLAFIHNAGVIHGDIKPNNVFVRPVQPSDFTQWNNKQADAQNTCKQLKYRAIFADFSAARFDAVESQQTESAGTYDYLAPELFSTELSSSFPSKASDVYALGVTLMTAVAGRSPYESARNIYARRAMAMQGLPLHFLAQHADAWERLELSRILPVLELALIESPVRRCDAEQWKDFVEVTVEDLETHG